MALYTKRPLAWSTEYSQCCSEYFSGHPALVLHSPPPQNVCSKGREHLQEGPFFVVPEHTLATMPHSSCSFVPSPLTHNAEAETGGKCRNNSEQGSDRVQAQVSQTADPTTPEAHSAASGSGAGLFFHKVLSGILWGSWLARTWGSAMETHHSEQLCLKSSALHF